MDDFMEKKASQKRPDSEELSTESLQAMSPVELADALERLLDTMAEEEYDPNLIDAYLDALEEKRPLPEEPDPEEALGKFQARLRKIPFRAGVDPAEKREAGTVRRRYPLKRMAVTAAATVALLFALMIGAQAAGMNIFGNLAQWTDELFFFLPSDKDAARNAEYQAMFQEALEEAGMPGELAPAWYPKGFTAEKPEIWNDDMGISIEARFKNEDGEVFVVSADKYNETVDFAPDPFEKDSGSVEIYTSNERTFYMMSNLNTITATWGDGSLVETIRGELSADEVKKMIDSMGG